MDELTSEQVAAVFKALKLDENRSAASSGADSAVEGVVQRLRSLGYGRAPRDEGESKDPSRRTPPRGDSFDTEKLVVQRAYREKLFRILGKKMRAFCDAAEAYRDLDPTSGTFERYFQKEFNHAQAYALPRYWSTLLKDFLMYYFEGHDPRDKPSPSASDS